MKLLSLNARGLRNIVKRKAIFIFCKDYNADIIFIQETHSCKEDEKLWKSQWGEDIWLTHGSNHSAGVAILTHKFKGKVLNTIKDTDGHWMVIITCLEDAFFILVNIYGYCSHSQNSKLLEELDSVLNELMSKYPVAKVILGGDFNMVMDNQLDRYPPKRTPNSKKLIEFTNRLDLIDIWRKKNTLLKTYTWSNNNHKLQSRIDFWLISADLEPSIESCTASPAVLTDHKAISLAIQVSKEQRGRFASGYWKLNNSLLFHEELKMKIEQLISEQWEAARKGNNFGTSWELLKYKIRGICSSYGKRLANKKKNVTYTLINNINKLTEKGHLSQEDNNTLLDLQKQLDIVYENKAKGAFVRSRRNWMEKGEKNSRYFFNMEKRRNEINSIRKLDIGEKISDDIKEISNYISAFYEKLYSKDINLKDPKEVLSLINSTNCVDAEYNEICCQDITLEEIIWGITNLKNNKSPGCDGLTSEMYKCFSESLGKFLLAVFKESLDRGELPPSLRQGVITLIPKPHKDSLLIENWRPITLLNNDYKILASILAKRLKSKLHTLIDECQSGFMKNRHIANNIRLVLDLIEYKDFLDDEHLILFLDFQKAFDTVSHKFIFDTLNFFNFGKNFINAVKTLYMGGNSCVKLDNGTSPRFYINKGIRQGCPTSPLLFLIVAQILCDLIHKSSFKGITLNEREIKISQLADDTTLFLKNKSQIGVALNVLNQFSESSGLNLNLSKCELFSLKNKHSGQIYGININNLVTYLGIKIGHNQKLMTESNISLLHNSINKKFDSWLARDLSMYGRVLLSKAEGLSRAAYLFSSIEIPKLQCANLDKLLYNFIWRKKPHKIRKNILTNKIEEGGLSVIDFSLFNEILKINWIKRFLKNPNSLWNIVPNFIFEKLGKITFLLQCPYSINRMPVKLSNFHKQALTYWSLLYKHNFSPHKCFIWNNMNIIYRNKTLFIENWFKHDILLVSQLLNNSNQILTYDDFTHKFNFQPPRKEFDIVTKAIPQGIITLLRNETVLDQFNKSFSSSVSINGLSFLDRKFNNKVIKNLLCAKSIPASRYKWSPLYENINWNRAWNNPHKFLITNKVKEISFKILHHYYPCNKIICKFIPTVDEKCSFCFMETETLDHLFYSCSYSSSLWNDIQDFINGQLGSNIHLSNFDIFFYFSDSNSSVQYLVNLIILLGKFFIHKSKFMNNKPLFNVFKIDLKNYIECISGLEGKSASKCMKYLSGLTI